MSSSEFAGSEESGKSVLHPDWVKVITLLPGEKVIRVANRVRNLEVTVKGKEQLYNVTGVGDLVLTDRRTLFLEGRYRLGALGIAALLVVWLVSAFAIFVGISLLVQFDLASMAAGVFAVVLTVAVAGKVSGFIRSRAKVVGYKRWVFEVPHEGGH